MATIDNAVEEIAKLRDLSVLVLNWAAERNFFGPGGSTAFDQRCKLLEEMGELMTALNKGYRAEAKDAIGDILVIAINISGFTITDRLTEGKFRHTDLARHQFYWNFSSILASSYLLPVEYVSLQQRVEEGHVTPYTRKGLCMVMFEYQMKEPASLFWLMALDLIAKSFDTTLLKCLEASYAVIKDRKGKMIDGAFVKEADLAKTLAQASPMQAPETEE